MFCTAAYHRSGLKLSQKTSFQVPFCSVKSLESLEGEILQMPAKTFNIGNIV